MADEMIRNRSLSGIGGIGPLPVTVGTLPSLLLILIFIGVPAISAIQLSLSRWSGIGTPRYIGLRNYSNVLTSADFWYSMQITLLYAACSAIGIVAIAAFLASTVNAKVRGSAFYKVVWFLPGLAPAAAVAIFWSSAFRPDSGMVNIVLGWLGLGDNHAWLGQTTTAIYPAIFVTIWVSVGFAFLVLLGAMQQIPRNLFEASILDGASARQQLFTITLPMVRPTMVVLLVLEFIWSFNNFTIIWAMTSGGPGMATSTLPVLVYKQAFTFTDFGEASAIAVIGGTLLFTLGIIGLRMSQSRQSA